MREHPAEGELQALLDGELTSARALVVRAHLVRCASCRARTNATRETAELVNALLRRSAPKVDSVPAWAGLVVRSGCHAAKARRGPARWVSALALALATAALIVMMVRVSRSNAGGLLTLSSVGEKVTVVIVYEDMDKSGTFTRGDIVRYVSTIPNGAPVAHTAR